MSLLRPGLLCSWEDVALLLRARVQATVLPGSSPSPGECQGVPVAADQGPHPVLQASSRSPCMSQPSLSRRPCLSSRAAGPALGLARSLPCSPPLPGFFSAVSSCDQEQQSALEEARQPKNDNVVIPECAHGGLYKPVQCHPSTGYCWCVLVDTGRPIPGTSTR